LQVTSATSQYALPETSRQPVQTLDKDAFLQLFIEQLKNQDPMSPQDSNALMSQMTQFSILEQLTNLNQSMSQLNETSLWAAMTQEITGASALLGRQVSLQTSDGVVSGLVEKITVTSDAVQVFVNGTGYELTQVTEIQ